MISFSDFLILSATIFTVLIFCQFGIAKRWLGALRIRPWASFIIIVWFSITLLPIAPDSDINIGNLGGSRIIRTAMIIFIFITSSISILKYPITIRLAGGSALWMALYGIYAIISSSYSISPIISLWKGFEVLSFVLCGIYLARHLKTLEGIEWLINILCLLLLYLIISTFYGVIISPSEAFPKTISSSDMAFAAFGVIPRINANTVTQISGMLLYLSLANMLLKRQNANNTILWLIICISLTTLLLGHSRTSIFGSAFILIILLVYGRHYVMASLIGTFCGIALIFGAWDAISEYITRGQSAEVFTSMSGRTVFWEAVWPTYLKSPILGYGFYSQRSIYGLSSLDNTYLQVLVGLGIVGLLIFVIPVGITAFKLIRIRPTRRSIHKEDVLWFQISSVYILILIRSLTGPTFQNLHINLIIVLIVMIATSALTRTITAKRKHKSLEIIP